MMVGPELAEATKIGRHVILVREYAGWGADELKALAGALTSADQRLLFCGGGLEEGHGAIVLAAGGEYEGDLGDALRTILPLFDGRGGGRGRFAQAVGNAEQLEQAMARAESILRELGENG